MTPSTVRVIVPPDADHVTLLRTAVTGVAARQGFTLEEVDDLRMGVEEAALLLLRRATDEPITLEIMLHADRIEASVSTVTTDQAPAVDRDSFSWTILSALVDGVRSDQDGAAARIVLTKHPTQSLPA